MMLYSAQGGPLQVWAHWCWSHLAQKDGGWYNFYVIWPILQTLTFEMLAEYSSARNASLLAEVINFKKIWVSNTNLNFV